MGGKGPTFDYLKKGKKGKKGIQIAKLQKKKEGKKNGGVLL